MSSLKHGSVSMPIEPQGVSDELLDVIASKPNVCKYLDRRRSSMQVSRYFAR